MVEEGKAGNVGLNEKRNFKGEGENVEDEEKD